MKNKQDNDQGYDLGWSPMLEFDSGVDANKLKQLDLERKDHRYLHGLSQRVKGIESHWLALLEKNFASDSLSQFSNLIHDESKLAESHGFKSIFELTTEIEGTLLAMGRNPGHYTDSIRIYMDSCVSTLQRTVNSLVDEAVSRKSNVGGELGNTNRHQAPRLYILDTQKDTAADLAIDLKGQGFKVFPVVDWQELERLCRLQKPAATLVVFNEDDSKAFIERLRHLISVDNGSVPCYVLAHEDSPENRTMVASSGANSFISLPCFVPALAAELHGLQHISLSRTMTFLVIGSPDMPEVNVVSDMFSEGEVAFIYTENINQLPYIAKDKQVDGLLLVDTGDEQKITRCMALVGQDQYLTELPMFVMLQEKQNYPDPVMRLISLTASDLFQQPLTKTLVLMRMQSRTLQYRRKCFFNSYMKTVDPESGLLLRQSFYQEVDKRVKQNNIGLVPSAITYVRLDYLREITEVMGISQIGDLKKNIAHRLISVLGPDDLVTTLSDNEYLVYSSREEAAAYRQVEWSIKNQIEQLGKEAMKDSKLTARVGISLFKDKDVLKAVNAAIAAINIQAESKAPVLEKSAPIITQRQATNNARNPVAKRIKKAMEEDRLTLLFQPIVSMEGDGFERYEVLMRMKEGEKELSPADFITENSPANVKRFLDRWVLNKALRVMKNTLPDKKDLKFFIKINEETISDKTFIDWLSRIFQVTEAPIERCVFEIKEQSVIDGFAESQSFINFVREQGAGVCIENFGARPQCLKLLDYVDIDYLKFDKECLGAIGSHDERDLRLNDIIDKANKLEVSTLAGFVETTSNLSLALQRGVVLFQGYFLQPPQEDMDFDFSMTM